MKRIGILGATAPGAIICAQHLLEEANRRGLRQPEISMVLLPPDMIYAVQKSKDWKAVAHVLLEGVGKLKGAGAEIVIIPSNTPHYAWPYLQPNSPLPLISIVEATVAECKARGMRRVGITGTSLTTGDGLYRGPLQEAGMEHLIAEADDRERMNEIIFGELVPTGKASASSVQDLLAIVGRLKAQGCDGVVLGCTELPLVLNEENVGLPTIDTTKVLAVAVLEYAME